MVKKKKKVPAADRASAPSGRKMKANGPLNKITSTMKNDWDSAKRSYGDFSKTDDLFEGLSKGGDRFLKRMGRGSYAKGMMKTGGYLAGAAILADFINPFSFGFND